MQLEKRLNAVIKIFIFIYLIVGLLILNSIKVKAYDKSKPFNAHDISTWNQNGGFPENTTMRLGKSSSTISEAGCGYYSIASMLVKCGYLDPKTQSPIDVIKKANEGDNTDASWGHFDSNKIGIFSENLSCVGSYVEMDNMTIKEGLAFLKKKYLEGYFLQVDLTSDLASTGGHYIFVDGFEGDDMIITDSAYSGTKWSDLYGKPNANTRWKYVNIYKDKTKKCNELASVYSADVGKLKSGAASGSEVSKSSKRMIEILEGYSADIAKHEKEGIYWVYCNSGCKLSYPKVLATAKEGEMVNGKKIHRVKVNCAQVVVWALVDMGILEYGQKLWGKYDNTVVYVKGAKESLEKWCEVNEYGANGKTAKQLEEEGKLVPGDICTWGSDYGGNHTNVYAGNGTWYDAGRGGSAYTSNMFPDIPMNDRIGTKCAIFKSLGPHKTVNMNKRPTAVIHINDYEGLSNEEKAINDKLVKEWDLRGMSGLESTYKDNQSPIELVDSTSLTVSESRNVDRIKENREERHISFIEKIRIFVNIVGVSLMLYGILLSVAGMFDRVNAFIDVSLLGIFTLGRWRLLPEGMEYVDSHNIGTYLTLKGLLIRVSILELSGLMLISGICYRFVLWVIYLLQSIFS